jgi:hypothetical protein
VIETKNYKGWILGDEKQRQWMQQIYGKKNRFQNPLHQNQLHVRALVAPWLWRPAAGRRRSVSLRAV